MIEKQNEANKLILNGDFSIAGVNDQLPLLIENLARLAEAAPDCFNTAQPYEVDLSEIQALDSCGCQLLATLFRNLRQRGAGKFSLKLSQEHRQKIHLFGFDNEIFAEEC